MIQIGEVIILNQSQADKLLSLGYTYRKKKIDNKTVFSFIQTPELMRELDLKFDKGSFFISKTVNF